MLLHLLFVRITVVTLIRTILRMSFEIMCRYPASPARDTQAVSGFGCDAVVFLVFNEYAKDCKTAVYGHKYGGASQVISSGQTCFPSEF